MKIIIAAYKMLLTIYIISYIIIKKNILTSKSRKSRYEVISQSESGAVGARYCNL